MAKIYYYLIKNGYKKLEDVPKILLEEVKELLQNDEK